MSAAIAALVAAGILAGALGLLAWFACRAGALADADAARADVERRRQETTLRIVQEAGIGQAPHRGRSSSGPQAELARQRRAGAPIPASELVADELRRLGRHRPGCSHPHTRISAEPHEPGYWCEVRRCTECGAVVKSSAGGAAA